MNSSTPVPVRIHNIGIVVESLDRAIEFFRALGLTYEGRMTIEDEWAGRVTGLPNQKVEIAMLATFDRQCHVELSQFLEPSVTADHRTAPINAFGYLRIMFNVPDLDHALAQVAPFGAKVVGEIVRYQDIYRLCYLRGPEGILIGLAEDLRR
jgi:catechol 2,3-dioxygenase-like lactoylglutathione lyase family enzyme